MSLKRIFGLCAVPALLSLTSTPTLAQDFSTLNGASQLVSSSVGATEAGLIYSANNLQSFVAVKEQQQHAIAQLIEERGAYGHGLDEAHSTLGQLYLENGEFSGAVREFKQAWHLSRVNSGLYSEQQLPYLTKLIQAQVELQDWEQVQHLHQLGFHIASRVYTPDDKRYLDAVDYYTSWQWEAIRERRNFRNFDEVFAYAQELSAFYSEVIDRIEHSGSDNTEGLVNLVLGKVRTDISIGRALLNSRLSGSVLGPGSFITETECFNGGLPGGSGIRHCRKIHLSSFNLENGSSMAINFALGRYLKQVDDSLARLERICATRNNLNRVEKNWVESLVVNLRAESESVFRPVRRT